MLSMRKRFITVFAAVLLLAAVICSAGCITPAPDPALGMWFTEEEDEDGATSVLEFEEGNTGTFFYIPNENDTSNEVVADSFVWEAMSDYKYSLQLSESGNTITVTLDPKSFTLTTKDKIVYSKMPNIIYIVDALFG